MGADHRAFLEATLPYVDVVWQVARQAVGDGQEPEDLVQETYLRAYAAFGSYRGESMRAWLAAICLNVARSEARRRRRRRWEVPARTLLDALPLPRADGAEGTAAAPPGRLPRRSASAWGHGCCLRGLPGPLPWRARAGLCHRASWAGCNQSRCRGVFRGVFEVICHRARYQRGHLRRSGHAEVLISRPLAAGFCLPGCRGAGALALVAAACSSGHPSAAAAHSSSPMPESSKSMPMPSSSTSMNEGMLPMGAGAWAA